MFAQRLISPLVLMLLFACATANAKSDDAEKIIYSVDLTDAMNHYINVQMQAVATDDETQLMMAVWTPGSYLVREYARHIDSLEVTDLSLIHISEPTRPY